MVADLSMKIADLKGDLADLKEENVALKARVHELTSARPGDPCPSCGAPAWRVKTSKLNKTSATWGHSTGCMRAPTAALKRPGLSRPSDGDRGAE